MLRQKLPRYAVPIFLRVSDKPADTTGNNKLLKGPLLKQGIEPGNISKGDKILWDSGSADKYVEFTQADYDKLVLGQARL